MNHDDIKRIFPSASQSLLAANLGSAGLSSERPPIQADAPDAMRAELEQCVATPAQRQKRAKTQDSERFLVRITSIRKCLIDEDNLCEKYVVDCCRYAGLLPEDSPSKTKIEVRQRKAEKGETGRTIVEIFSITA